MPLFIGLGYTVYKMYNKRKLRNPDGPYLGGTPFFGAVLLGVASVLFGFGMSMPVVNLLPGQVMASLGKSIVVPLTCILLL